jgi:hypothetical protein
MEEAARMIAKAFGNCMTDRCVYVLFLIDAHLKLDGSSSSASESRKWGVYYVVGLVLKCYFRLKKISLSKNILRALEANTEIPPLSEYPRSHQVRHLP